MKSDRLSARAHSKLVTAWQELLAGIEKLNDGVVVRPSDPNDVIHFDDKAAKNVVSFNVSPVVFRLPESARALSLNLFVVVAGRIAFSRADLETQDVLVTESYGTEVAYFRYKGARFEHAFGAHYDISIDEVAHPFFHGQIKSFAQRKDTVTAHYHIDGEIDDRVAGMLKNVRVPCAQLDVFSVFLQLCADHLVNAMAPAEKLVAFNKLLTSASYRGAVRHAPRLIVPAAVECYRARHWYPTIEK